MAEKFRVVLTGGGSGGHVYPLLAVAEALQDKCDALHADVEFHYLGPNDAYSTLLTSRGVKMHAIASGKLRRYMSVQNFLDAPKFLIGLVQALAALYMIMPDVVFSKGGTGALPVVMAAWFYRIPIAIHDSDAQPGLTNVHSGRFASRVFVSFERAAAFFSAKKVMITGSPLRTELLGERIPKEAAKEIMGFDKTQPLVLILGGSQGSMRINEFVVVNLAQFISQTSVLHQTGPANIDEDKKLSSAALANQPVTFRYMAVGYFGGAPGSGNDMATALTAADLVVSRSGSAVCEFAAFGLPAILIPITESANDHQRVDAYEFAKNGAGVVIEEANLVPGIFFSQLKKILDDADLRAKMSAASSAFFIPGAAEKIADELMRMGG
ncbi:MAG TPA: UDP-N-acetylglucosamine--N-acetylmuramyl-(pentapeptide) pyrophosphoryl-undecaprenol N-acetylglucosamine transferase [Candidatus Paceibacterota bacterium]|nr:UDP-N-acetylglucosamine--N-acetylmuramyl-(pentapeptide) pyrophosphoryl-undecaprenol N-acetylglucosamine transferase [Candidatus Paceibacterota bacterium]